MEKSTDLSDAAAGLAALGICESLLLALTDLKIIDEKDMRGLLTDVISTHLAAGDNAKKPKMHQAVVEIVQGLLASKHRNNP